MMLNLGCGHRHLPGFVNVDLKSPCDRQVDLFELPWPWPTDSQEAVVATNFVEHWEQPWDFMREAHRVLKPGRPLVILVPHYRNPQAVGPRHRSYYSYYTLLDWLDSQGSQRLYCTASLELVYPAFRPSLGRWLHLLANQKPLAWDWLGLPCDSLRWIGLKRGLHGTRPDDESEISAETWVPASLLRELLIGQQARRPAGRAAEPAGVRQA